MNEIIERLVRIEANLAEHMRRTEAAEKRLELVEEAQHETLRHQAAWAGAGRALAAVGSVLSIAAAVWRAFG